MKTFYLTKQYDENFIEITKWLDELKDEEGVIYINNGGGSIWVADAILNRINSMNITLKSHYLCSSGFYLFYFFTGKKELIKCCEAIIHAITMTSDIFFNDKGEIKVQEDDIFFERMKETGIPKEYFTFLTGDEINKIYNGKDVLLDYERLLKIFGNK